MKTSPRQVPKSKELIAVLETPLGFLFFWIACAGDGQI
jgi:hypothetical protein